MPKSEISILGCGWMGLPAGKELVNDGWTVRGSTTRTEKLDALHNAGIEPFLLRLDPDLEKGGETDLDRFFASPVLFLNVPPPRDVEDREAFHLQQLETVTHRAEAGGVDWIVFASSTSVYPSGTETWTEAEQPPGDVSVGTGHRRRSGEILLKAEQRLREADLDVTILRFAGLYGGDRHPARYLAGRTDLSRPEAPVNLIHRDDCIGILQSVLAHDARGKIFNAVADAHPSRRALYTQAAKSRGLDAPHFDDADDTGGKVITNNHLKDVLGYTFQHPDPMRME